MQGGSTVFMCFHGDVIKWKHFPRFWPLVREIHQSPVNSPHKGQWRWGFDVVFDLRLNKQWSKPSRRWWFETPSRSLWRHRNVLTLYLVNWTLAHCDIFTGIYSYSMFWKKKNIHEAGNPIYDLWSTFIALDVVPCYIRRRYQQSIEYICIVYAPLINPCTIKNLLWQARLLFTKR